MGGGGFQNLSQRMETAQHSRVLTAPVEDPSSVPAPVSAEL